MSKEGHEAIVAKDGREAVECFKNEQPDLILMDALMPVLDGMGAAREIRALAGEDMIPIIFLTSLQDAASLADCLQAGGDDFLSKPYNRLILKAKIEAFARMQRLHRTVQVQRDEIYQHHNRLLHEQEIAKKVFDNIAHPGCLDAPNIKHLLSPMAVFNGDFVLAARKPNGGMYVFLGDFTGHGLPAAVGALPVSEIFYGMALKGFSMQDILREINTKLKRILPVGMFCCACMADLSFHNETLEYWMGGLPDAVLRKEASGEQVLLRSTNLPLGVLNSDKFNTDTSVLPMVKGDRLYIWSDGISEASNSEGDQFGEEGVYGVFNTNHDVETLFDELLAAVYQHTGSIEQDDDYTVVEVTQVAEGDLGEYFGERRGSLVGGPVDWSMTYELRPLTLRDSNPLPMLTHLLMEIPGLRAHSGKIYTILAELYSNALEHGVLGLSSDLKASPTGFAQYYAEREAGLARLDTGWVRFSLEHKPLDEAQPNLGGCLYIEVEDTGPGFEQSKVQTPNTVSEGYCGRGLPLISTLCKRVDYHGAGNRVAVQYEWNAEA